MSSLLGGTPKTTSTSTSEATLPSWLLPSIQNLVGKTNALMDKPYEAYDGQRIADFNGDETASFDMIRQLMGSTAGAYSSAQGTMNEVANRGLNGFSQDTLNQYMNPYQENVLDVEKRRSLEQFDQAKKGLASQQANISAFGGSRSGIAEQNLYKNFSQQLADRETQGLAANFDQAQNRAFQGTQLAGQAAMNQAGLATQGLQTGLTEAGALGQIGSQQRALDQAGLDVNYQDFLTEQAYPYEQLQFASSLLYPAGQLMRGENTTQTQKTSGGGSGFLGTALGLASMAAGVPGLGSMFGAGATGLGSLIGGSGGIGGSLFGAGTGLSAGLSAGQIGRMASGGFSGMYGPGFADGGLVGSINNFIEGYANGGQVPGSYIPQPNAAGLNAGQAGGYEQRTPTNAYTPDPATVQSAAEQEKYDRKFADGGSVGNLSYVPTPQEIANITPMMESNAIALPNDFTKDSPEFKDLLKMIEMQNNPDLVKAVANQVLNPDGDTRGGMQAAIQAEQAPIVNQVVQAPQGIAAAKQPNSVLSVRNNNPGNLRPSGSSQGFQSFDTPEAGLGAMRGDLLTKIGGNSRMMKANFGDDYTPTLKNIIHTWAPPSENDTSSYVKFVSEKTGIKPNQPVTPADVDKLMLAMVEKEGGKQATKYFGGVKAYANGGLVDAVNAKIKQSGPLSFGPLMWNDTQRQDFVDGKTKPYFDIGMSEIMGAMPGGLGAAASIYNNGDKLNEMIDKLANPEYEQRQPGSNFSDNVGRNLRNFNPLLGEAAVSPIVAGKKLAGGEYQWQKDFNKPHFTDEEAMTKGVEAYANTPEKAAALREVQNRLMAQAMAKQQPASAQATTEKEPAKQIAQGLASATQGKPMSETPFTGENKSKKSGANWPLIAFGATLLGSDKGFFQALGQAGGAALSTKQAEDTQAAAAQKQTFDQQMAMIRAQLYGKQIEAQTAKVNDPYSKQLQALKVAKLQQEVEGGNMQKRVENTFRTLIQSGMYQDPQEAMEAAKKAVITSAVAGNMESPTANEAAPTDDLSSMTDEQLMALLGQQ